MVQSLLQSAFYLCKTACGSIMMSGKEIEMCQMRISYITAFSLRNCSRMMIVWVGAAQGGFQASANNWLRLPDNTWGS